MSLKIFHIFFITVSALLGIVLASWGLRGYAASGTTSQLIQGLIGIGLLILLIPYLRWFRRKMAKMGPLTVALLSLGSSGLVARSALACVACFGDPNSPMSKAARMGALSLGIFIGSVLFGILVIGLTWARRARSL